MLTRFTRNQHAIFWVIFVGVTTIMVATVTWLVAMLITGQFVDSFTLTATTPYTAEFGETVRNQGAVVIVIIDVGMIVWMAVSAFKRERQEMPYA